MEIKNIPIVEKKKLVASGASVVVVIPKQWLKENGLGVGSEVLMVANGDCPYELACPDLALTLENEKNKWLGLIKLSNINN